MRWSDLRNRWVWISSGTSPAHVQPSSASQRQITTSSKASPSPMNVLQRKTKPPSQTGSSAMPSDTGSARAGLSPLLPRAARISSSSTIHRCPV
ncbi:hypothetical protein EMPG_15965 [Blastomyces silverae]|uniref:Uncharacterized protein n=1 Tax=Blastomyces silverae TaxID=2060906 RepID=A0A0H1BC43_9EURO|nr:hypothetical protein EMPG_15965 [Blastomyces silverae]